MHIFSKKPNNAVILSRVVMVEKKEKLCEYYLVSFKYLNLLCKVKIIDYKKLATCFFFFFSKELVQHGQTYMLPILEGKPDGEGIDSLSLAEVSFVSAAIPLSWVSATDARGPAEVESPALMSET